jgi:fatty acid desaturase
MTAVLVAVAGGSIDALTVYWLARQTPERRKAIFRKAIRIVLWLYAAQAAFGFGVGFALPWLIEFHII